MGAIECGYIPLTHSSDATGGRTIAAGEKGLILRKIPASV